MPFDSDGEPCDWPLLRYAAMQSPQGSARLARVHWILIMLAAAVLNGPLGAQSRDTSSKQQATPAPSCCSIVRVDTINAVVTAREIATGYTFTFSVKSRRTLRGLRIGQPVWADFTTNTVRLKPTDVTPCCGILPREMS